MQVRARAQDSHVTAAMDVFSVGCTVAELLLHEPLFQYADMVDLVHNDRLSTATQVPRQLCCAVLRSVARLLLFCIRH